MTNIDQCSTMTTLLWISVSEETSVAFKHLSTDYARNGWVTDSSGYIYLKKAFCKHLYVNTFTYWPTFWPSCFCSCATMTIWLLISVIPIIFESVVCRALKSNYISKFVMRFLWIIISILVVRRKSVMTCNIGSKLVYTPN